MLNGGSDIKYLQPIHSGVSLMGEKGEEALGPVPTGGLKAAAI